MEAIVHNTTSASETRLRLRVPALRACGVRQRRSMVAAGSSVPSRGSPMQATRRGHRVFATEGTYRRAPPGVGNREPRRLGFLLPAPQQVTTKRHTKWQGLGRIGATVRTGPLRAHPRGSRWDLPAGGGWLDHPDRRGGSGTRAEASRGICSSASVCRGSNPMATSGAGPARHVAAGTALAKRAQGFGVRQRALVLVCRRLMAGRCTHDHNHYPVVTSGRSTGDFEGCARPSQPTIGIAAASSLIR
jgi:hypothetical protein